VNEYYDDPDFDEDAETEFDPPELTPEQQAKQQANREKWKVQAQRDHARHLLKVEARRALNAGQTLEQWIDALEDPLEPLAPVVWREVEAERASRVKSEQAQGPQLRESPERERWRLQRERYPVHTVEPGAEVQVQAPAQPSHRRGLYPVPPDVEHTSGYVAAHDSGIGKLLGGTAYTLWCHMLRLASPSERHRRIEGLDQDALGEDVGLTRQQVRDALARLTWVGMVTVAKPGRFGGGWAKGLTAVYSVPAVTTARLDAWREKLAEPGTWAERLEGDQGSDEM